MSAYINMLTELNFSVLWNMNVVFVDTDSGSQTGTCLFDIKVAAHAGTCNNNFLELHDMFELTWNSFPLKLNEGPSFRYRHVPQRESLHFVTDFCDVVILEEQSILCASKMTKIRIYTRRVRTWM